MNGGEEVAENRLIMMETLSSVPTGAKKKLVFGYDWQGRRISKTVSNWVSGAWALAETKRFLYDGWNLIKGSVPTIDLFSKLFAMWTLAQTS
mgnify:CR=1 FL=1